MNAAQGECRFQSATSGQLQRPHMMHFAGREAPFAYAMQLRRLFAKFNVIYRRPHAFGDGRRLHRRNEIPDKESR